MAKKKYHYESGWRNLKPVLPTGGGKVIQSKLQPMVSIANPCKNIRGNPCASKLVFLKPEDAKEFGTKPGANLMYCLGEGKIGPVVPVKDGADATRLGKKWCACSTSKDPSICAGEARLDRTAREHTEVLKFAGRRRRARSFSADRSQGRSRSRLAGRPVCDADMARDQALQDVTDWDDWDSDFKVRTPKVVWRTLIRDAGLRPADLVRAEKVAEKDDGHERREIWKKLVEQIKNASNAQVCAYDRQRSSAINRDIW